MPIFEYVCGDCQHQFEALVTASRQPECPTCHSQKLDKQFSTFAALSSSGGAKARQAQTMGGGCGTCGDPRGPGACSLN